MKFNKKIKQEVQEVTKCPECGKPGTLIPPSTPKNKILEANFICPNNHTFIKLIPLI